MIRQPGEEPVVRKYVPIDEDQRDGASEAGNERRGHGLIEQGDSLQRQAGLSG
jgi:hypothetical protein